VTSAAEQRTLALLAFWGRNMASIRARGWVWPGFDYGEAEWQRLLALAQGVSGDAYLGFQIVTVVLVVASIALVVTIGVGIVALPYRMIPSEWAQLGPPGLLLAISVAVFVLFGYGFPFAIRLAAAFVAHRSMRAKLAALPGDAELAAKIARQFRRMAAFIAGVLFLIAASEFYLPDGAQHWAALAIAVGAGFVALIWL
jgi:hypothetical protein